MGPVKSDLIYNSIFTLSANKDLYFQTYLKPDKKFGIDKRKNPMGNIFTFKN